MDANSTPKAQNRVVRLLWLLGLIAGVVVGTAVAFGIAGTQGSTQAPAGISRAA